MDSKERAKKIRELMKEKRMSNVWLADKTGVHKNTICRALNGECGVRIETLIAIANGIGVEPAELL